MKTVSTYLFAFSILFSLIVSCDQRKSATGINGESGFSNFIDSIGIENIWENEEFLIFDNSLDSLVDNLENEYARSNFISIGWNETIKGSIEKLEHKYFFINGADSIYIPGNSYIYYFKENKLITAKFPKNSHDTTTFIYKNYSGQINTEEIVNLNINRKNKDTIYRGQLLIFDEQGRTKKEVTYDPMGYRELSIFKYDKNGNISDFFKKSINSINKSEENTNKLWHHVFKNENGIAISENLYIDGILTSSHQYPKWGFDKSTYKFKFDSRGNWIEARNLSGMKELLIREITYKN